MLISLSYEKAFLEWEKLSKMRLLYSKIYLEILATSENFLKFCLSILLMANSHGNPEPCNIWSKVFITEFSLQIEAFPIPSLPHNHGYDRRILIDQGDEWGAQATDTASTATTKKNLLFYKA